MATTGPRSETRGGARVRHGARRLEQRCVACAAAVVAAPGDRGHGGGRGRDSGLRRDELGLGNIRAGLRWGSAAAALPVVGYAVALAVPSLHDRFAVPDDVRDDFGEWVSAHIPFGTVATEELLFRGLLTAVTEQAFPPAGATAIRAVTFGLWHVHPAHVADDSVPGTVAFTAAASLVFDWLRARSGSLLAPALLHLAVNAGGALLLRRIQVTTGAREVPLPPV
ncbi:CPBP family intramembrane glutamic endopeptidase [Prescottella equi]|uniref:CPBP family intramembrane glutamic endopeptidase n=1 Tax=Rhodococcus hoagii TaxID=43767 RepID=UPI003AF32121